MASTPYAIARPPWREQLAYQLRVLRVIAGAEYKLMYADSALGYMWSLAKPLSYFAILWVVFGRFFEPSIENFPVFLLLGIVLYMFFVDAVGMTVPSIVRRGPVLRRISFPPVVIPIAVTLTAAITFCVNAVAVGFFLAIARIEPRPHWLLVIPLLAELYVFIVGLGLIVATLYVRFRDVGQIWDLTARLLLFASPIMYPITVLPDWMEHVVALNPFVQIIEDVRLAIMGSGLGPSGAADPDLVRPVAIALALATFGFGLWLYRREAPRFAEQA
jgi:ABC-2 type transport system permease protein